MIVLLSKTFYCGGTANGSDITPEFNVGTAAPIGHIGAEPWEAVSINIVGIGMTFFQMPSGLQYAFAGDSYSPDIMLEMAAGQTSLTKFFPAGLSFPFPAAGAVTPPPHVDMHICAANGSPFQAHYTVYYTKNAQ